ncbi:hypothetical protein LJB71_11390 [Thermomonas sp. S9]|uniref:hypothetical protein n=1 Tax=Thermomonas sp. S9 TaxID=2885203 RepID=UPI00216B5974|nr:hypothetical protein [Thermomonas sp. S9]MCR6496752.1 hypothetical protein [Thermomonas sp. S9]
MGLISRFRQAFSHQSQGWWDSFAVSLGEDEFTVTECKRGKPAAVTKVSWLQIASVCFVDGGQGSDCFYVFSANGEELAMVPAQGPGGQAFWDELKWRNLFPEDISGLAVRSANQGAQLWWPPRHGR